VSRKPTKHLSQDMCCTRFEPRTSWIQFWRRLAALAEFLDVLIVLRNFANRPWTCGPFTYKCPYTDICRKSQNNNNNNNNHNNTKGGDEVREPHRSRARLAENETRLGENETHLGENETRVAIFTFLLKLSGDLHVSRQSHWRTGNKNSRTIPAALWYERKWYLCAGWTLFFLCALYQLPAWLSRYRG
jgi:hypothetical protein